LYASAKFFDFLDLAQKLLIFGSKIFSQNLLLIKPLDKKARQT